jgi:hypothetical protein
MTIIHSTDNVTVVVWTEKNPTWNGLMLTRTEAERLADHKRFFWNDDRTKDKLLWIGPAAELMGDAPNSAEWHATKNRWFRISK